MEGLICLLFSFSSYSIVYMHPTIHHHHSLSIPINNREKTHMDLESAHRKHHETCITIAVTQSPFIRHTIILCPLLLQTTQQLTTHHQGKIKEKATASVFLILSSFFNASYENPKASLSGKKSQQKCTFFPSS